MQTLHIIEKTELRAPFKHIRHHYQVSHTYNKTNAPLWVKERERHLFKSKAVLWNFPWQAGGKSCHLPWSRAIRHGRLTEEPKGADGSSWQMKPVFITLRPPRFVSMRWDRITDVSWGLKHWEIWDVYLNKKMKYDRLWRQDFIERVKSFSSLVQREINVFVRISYRGNLNIITVKCSRSRVINLRLRSPKLYDVEIKDLEISSHNNYCTKTKF